MSGNGYLKFRNDRGVAEIGIGVKEFKCIGESPPQDHPHVYINMGETDTIPTGVVFRETTADYENSWHRAPRRQYVISLAGGISITASDGETRHIGAGEIVLVEDTTGKGHITRSSGDGPRHTIFVPVD